MNTPDNARAIAARYDIPLHDQFHALRSDVVARIVEAADEYRYRAPRAANGSRARYFHAYLVRRAIAAARAHA